MAYPERIDISRNVLVMRAAVPTGPVSGPPSHTFSHLLTPSHICSYLLIPSQVCVGGESAATESAAAAELVTAAGRAQWAHFFARACR